MDKKHEKNCSVLEQLGFKVEGKRGKINPAFKPSYRLSFQHEGLWFEVLTADSVDGETGKPCTDIILRTDWEECLNTTSRFQVDGASNGFIVQAGGETTIHSSLYDVSQALEAFYRKKWYAWNHFLWEEFCALARHWEMSEAKLQDIIGEVNPQAVISMDYKATDPDDEIKF